MKQFTKKQLAQKVWVTCYRQKKEMTRKEAIETYFEGMVCCDGSEAERYQRIYCQLMEGFRQVTDERDY